MGTSKRYNSVPVKDNCAQCLFTPYFRRRAILGCYLNLPPINPDAIATIQKLQNFALQPMEISKRYNSVLAKDNCALFAPSPLLGPRLSDGVI